MFTRARARIALAIQAAAMALGLIGVSRGPVVSPTTAASPKASRPRAKRNAPRKRRHSSLWTPNGAQECQRRRVQIRRGMLNPSNGLLFRGSDTTYCANSHGESIVWPY
jgi:hypothetical protein